MDIKIDTGSITFEKELSDLDMFVLDFIKILDESKIKYVLISGYVSILFGRNRSSEDIDIIMQKQDFGSFKSTWENLSSSFECINTENIEEAYNDYLSKQDSIRFSKKGEFIPNMEIKFTKTELDKYVLDQKKKVVLNDKKIYISPLEIQIAYKLFLGSNKDIEDAKYLYELFKEKLDLRLLNEYIIKLKTKEIFDRYLK